MDLFENLSMISEENNNISPSYYMDNAIKLIEEFSTKINYIHKHKEQFKNFEIKSFLQNCSKIWNLEKSLNDNYFSLTIYDIVEYDLIRNYEKLKLVISEFADYNNKLDKSLRNRLDEIEKESDLIHELLNM